jgi:hypothetical protein
MSADAENVRFSGQTGNLAAMKDHEKIFNLNCRSLHSFPGQKPRSFGFRIRWRDWNGQIQSFFGWADRRSHADRACDGSRGSAGQQGIR